jgi:membrane protein YdbS with pleckstrin-like domain
MARKVADTQSKPVAAPKKLPNLMTATFLGSEEEFVWEGRPSGFLYFPPPLFFLFLVLVYDFLVYDSLSRALNAQVSSYLPTIPSWLNFLVGATSVESWQVIVALVLLLIAILFLAERWFRRAATVYALTNTRFIRQKGIVSKDFDEVQLRQIRGIEVKQSLGQRALGYGTIRLSAESGAANSLGNELWPGFPKPTKFQKLVEDNQERLAGVTRPQPTPAPTSR